MKLPLLVLSLVNLSLFIEVFSATNSEFIRAKGSKISSIDILSDSLLPNYLEIPLNTKVVFVNKTKDKVWIASDDHPTHQIFPEFDSKGSIDSGGKWEFLFDKSGLFAYHDHLKPTLKGTVVVLDIDGPSSKNSEKNSDASKKLLVTNEIKMLAEEKDPLYAWDFFRKNYKNDDFDGIHDIAHYLGSLIYSYKGLEAVDRCDDSFQFGCYHGVIENFIAEKGFANLNDFVAKCENLSLKKNVGTCFHGIGHGILAYKKYDLISALKSCEEFIDTKYTEVCWMGVFMEKVSSSTADIYLIKDSSSPCADLESKYKKSCYLFQSFLFNKKFGFDVEKMSKECIALEIQEYRDSCFDGFSDFITHKYIKDPDEIVKICKSITIRFYQDLCIFYSAEEYTYQGYSYQVSIDKFCELLVGEIRDGCKQRVYAIK